MINRSMLDKCNCFVRRLPLMLNYIMPQYVFLIIIMPRNNIIKLRDNNIGTVARL